jgi:hypothetical protein
MTTLKDFPFKGKSSDYPRSDLKTALEWKEKFEAYIQAQIAYHTKTIEKWERCDSKNALYKYRDQIASEWRVSLGTLKTIVGDDSPMPKYPDEQEDDSQTLASKPTGEKQP